MVPGIGPRNCGIGKLAGLIQLLSGGHLIIALVLTMALSIILGCAMPTPVAYVVAALVVSPVLVDMGLTRMTSHFFVFYFAILSAVTPPVAGASMVGSQIANAGYLITGWESLKLSAPFFLVPYFIVKNPIVLSHSQPVASAILAIIALLVACGAMLVFCQGFCLVKTGTPERILFLVVALLATSYGQYGAYFALILSTGTGAVLLMMQWKRWKAQRDTKR